MCGEYYFSLNGVWCAVEAYSWAALAVNQRRRREIVGPMVKRKGSVFRGGRDNMRCAGAQAGQSDARRPCMKRERLGDTSRRVARQALAFQSHGAEGPERAPSR